VRFFALKERALLPLPATGVQVLLGELARFKRGKITKLSFRFRERSSAVSDSNLHTTRTWLMLWQYKDPNPTGARD
jgi:hypothetical protein